MRRIGFNEGWEFSRNGGQFEAVTVPHDAMLGERRGPKAPAGSASGYFYGGTYRYRKSFSLSEAQASHALILEFEGVYRNARIRVNGTPVDAPPYGFVPFFIDITTLAVVGQNLIEVEADNSSQPDCRWYSGAGIHRPVWLWEGEACRIEPEGVRVTTLSTAPATVQVDVECTGGVPEIRIYDEEDDVVASASGAHAVMSIPHARPWSADQPSLYRCTVTLLDEGRVADEAETTFGIRMLEWNPDGLFVNGRETLLRGGCIHCDNGILGAASFATSERRRVRLLKEAGFNAIRIAHNPASSALLDACDELGMYVIDEAWDVWYTRKSTYDYARDFLDWCDFDLRRMAQRDYNHPSVIMYSIGNEIADPIQPRGVQLERSMVELLHSIDSTRPVTCGLNLTMMVMERIGRSWYGNAEGVAEAAGGTGAPRGSMLFNLAAQAGGAGMTALATVPGADKLVSPALDALDIAGYNYASARYARDARKHPERIVVGTETFSHELVRNWESCERIPNLIGDFMWAAWDYIGEAGAGAWAYTADEAGFVKPWPWLLAGSGAIDILGNPNAAAALAGAVWRTTLKPSIQVRPVNIMGGKTYKATWRGSDAIPSWSWKGCEGVRTVVEVYHGTAHSIRLDLNGQTVAETRVRDCVAKFPVAYQPGTLEAFALDENGGVLGRSTLVSANAPLHIAAHPERKRVPAGDIAYIPIAIEGSNGEVESNADATLTVTAEGCELLAFGSARPAHEESFLSGTHTTYRGRALAIIRKTEPGEAAVAIAGGGLPAAHTRVEFV